MSQETPNNGKPLRDPELAEKEGRILELKAQGWRLEDIGKEVGMTKGGVSKAWRRALNRYPATAAEEYRAQQNMQLDELEQETWDIYRQALQIADLELALKAQDRVQKWLDRRAKLNGIDAPVKTEMDISGAAFKVRIPKNRLSDKAIQEIERESAEQDAEGGD